MGGGIRRELASVMTCDWHQLRDNWTPTMAQWRRHDADAGARKWTPLSARQTRLRRAKEEGKRKKHYARAHCGRRWVHCVRRNAIDCVFQLEGVIGESSVNGGCT